MSFIGNKKFLFGIILIIFFGYFPYTYYVSPPKNFPINSDFTVDEDESIKTISENLKNESYIKSAFLFRTVVSFTGNDKKIQLGGYIFEKPLSLFSIIKKVVYEKPNKPLIRVTIPEGSTTKEVATIIKRELPNFSIENFLENVDNNSANGKLFPSTYFFLPSTTEARALFILTSTFEDKYKNSFENNEIPKPLKNENEVIILASILEGEANTQIDMKIVAGIILNRLTIGMPIQVDVAEETYSMKGLPKEPINNPGMDALNAVFHSTSTDYYYYITGNDGKMYYAKTFDEHKRNISRYLK